MEAFTGLDYEAVVLLPIMVRLRWPVPAAPMIALMARNIPF
jgi:hypothetical protein